MMTQLRWISLSVSAAVIIFIVMCQPVAGQRSSHRICESPMLPIIFLKGCQSRSDSSRPLSNPMRRKRGEAITIEDQERNSKRLKALIWNELLHEMEKELWTSLCLKMLNIASPGLQDPPRATSLNQPTAIKATVSRYLNILKNGNGLHE